MEAPPDPDRGQAFTLEAVISGLVLVTAVLFAIQSVAVTPTTGGSVADGPASSTRAEAGDVLATVAENETFGLSEVVRYWSPDQRTFHGGRNPRVGYGSESPPGTLGTLLNETFTDRGRTYNLVVEYQRADTANGTGSVPLVYRGEPSAHAVTVSRTVTLYDNTTLTSPGQPGVELWEYGTDPAGGESDYYPIPDAAAGPVYNVVEVRLTVW